MTRAFALAAAVLLLTAADTPITKKNWLKHPRIESIRAKVNAIQKGLDDKLYTHEDQPGCDAPAMITQRDGYRDEAGHLRLYTWEGGSDDSAYSMKRYYDERGQLQFVHATMGAVNDSSVEFRIYFEDGAEIWRDVKRKGPGYTWNPDFPNAYLKEDPEKALKAKLDC